MNRKLHRFRAVLPGIPRDRREWTAASVVGVVLVVAAWRFAAVVLVAAARLWWLAPATVVCVAGVALVRLRTQRTSARARAARLALLRLPLVALDGMDPQEFELAIRDLMIRDGIAARHVGQRGDQAADAIGRDRWGRTYVAQCKHTTVGGRVGSQVMYQIKGTAGPVHGAEFGVLVTNGRVTRDARAWGDLNAVHWLDRERLRLWAEEGVALQEVLKLPGRRRGWRAAAFGRRRPPWSVPAAAPPNS